MTVPYLDSSAIIYLIEGTAATRALVSEQIAVAEADPSGLILTSHLARIECRVRPLRMADAALVATYDRFFCRARVGVVELSRAAIDQATDLRVRYGFKTADALHLGAAIVAGADLFVTGDAALARCGEIPVGVVAPIQ